MFKTVISEVLAPLSRRAGSFVAGTLTGLGVATETATVIATGAAALVSVSVDLILSSLNRRRQR